MEQAISDLLRRFETGTLTRRKLIAGLALLARAHGTAAASGFQAVGINHVSLQVSDLDRSRDFYTKVFGLQVLGTDPTGNVRLGQPNRNFLVLRAGSPSGRIDHFGFGIENFDEKAVIQDLRDRGANPENVPVIGLHVKDPDGFPAQVIANNR